MAVAQGKWRFLHPTLQLVETSILVTAIIAFAFPLFFAAALITNAIQFNVLGQMGEDEWAFILIGLSVALVFTVLTSLGMILVLVSLLLRTFKVVTDEYRLPPPWVLFLLGLVLLPANAVLFFVAYAIDPLLSLVPFFLLGIPVLVLPALFWVAVAQSYGGRVQLSTRVMTLSLLWGVFSAVGVILLRDGLIVPGLLLAGMDPGFIQTWILAPVLAPLTEELWKPLALLLFLRWIHSRVEGVAYGIAMGMGFAMFENVSYFLSFYDTYPVLSVMRGVGLLIHTVGPVMVGYAIGKWREDRGKGSFLWVIPALGVGIVIHASWNGSLTIVGAIIGGLGELAQVAFCFGALAFALLVLLSSAFLVLYFTVRAKRTGRRRRRILGFGGL